MLNADNATLLAETFKLLGDPTRLRILATCLEERLSVGEIATRLGLAPSLVSHHLRLLRGARMLRAEREGKQVYYLAIDDHVRDMLTGMAAHVGEADGQD